MTAFEPVTDVQLAQARSDPVFRQKLLEQSLEVLLAGVQKLRNASPGSDSADGKQMREAIELAIRLAEIIQAPNRQSHGRP